MYRRGRSESKSFKSKGEASNQDDIILHYIRGHLGRAIRPKERAGYRAMGGAISHSEYVEGREN